MATKPAELRTLPPTIRIDQRFCGPPDSANGGYVSGRLARYIAGSALVRLEVPPPLDADMQVKEAGSGFELMHGATVVARARPAVMSLDIPAPPTVAESEAAAKAYRGFRAHPFPTCFVCGPERTAGDGLRIFPGPLRSGVVASPWIPDASLGDSSGRVRVEFVWSALDCPGAFSFDVPDKTPVLLGEFGASMSGPVKVGERYIVLGWELARDGRRHFTGTALFSESGECRAIGRATWFEVPPGPAT
ncbi:MAG TPA: hypothetical protein VLD15_00395 [Burkholderiales bacterium]|nr:hypothetical protein [Burkholderiales bacterium]